MRKKSTKIVEDDGMKDDININDENFNIFVVINEP